LAFLHLIVLFLNARLEFVHWVYLIFGGIGLGLYRIRLRIGDVALLTKPVRLTVAVSEITLD
jgi:hypothetical protein